MGTALVAVESFLLMLYNTLITFFGIFVYSVTEKDIYEAELLRNPKMLHCNRAHSPDLKSIGIALLDGCYCGVVVLFFHYSYYGNGIHHKNGINDDLYAFQTSVTVTNVMISVIRVLTMTNIFNTSVIIGIVLAMLANYITMLVGNFWTAFGIGQVGQIGFLYTSWSSNLLITACVCIASLPDLCFRFMRRYLAPNPAEAYMMSQDKYVHRWHRENEEVV